MDEVLLTQAVQIDGNASAEIQVFVKTKMSTSRDVDKEQITTKRIREPPKMIKWKTLVVLTVEHRPCCGLWHIKDNDKRQVTQRSVRWQRIPVKIHKYHLTAAWQKYTNMIMIQSIMPKPFKNFYRRKTENSHLTQHVTGLVYSNLSQCKGLTTWRTRSFSPIIVLPRTPMSLLTVKLLPLCFHFFNMCIGRQPVSASGN